MMRFHHSDSMSGRDNRRPEKLAMRSNSAVELLFAGGLPLVSLPTSFP